MVDMRYVGASDVFRDGITRNEGMQYHCAGLHRLYTCAELCYWLQGDLVGCIV